MAIVIVSLTACSNNADDPAVEGTVKLSPTGQSGNSTSPPEPTSTSTSSSNTAPDATINPAGIATGERPPGFSPEKLPLRKLTFSISTPSNTPADEPIYLAIIDLTGGTDQHVEMKNIGGGQYETTVEVQSRSMIRYTYDRHDGTNCCDSNLTREAIGDQFEMQYRLLITDQVADKVNDTIPTWNDLRAVHEEGTITGHVYDSESGEPIFDANVSISGIHVGTRTDGNFKVEGLPPGEHTIVVHSDTGDFLPEQTFLSFFADGSRIGTEYRVEKTKLVPVTFDVFLPDSTPEDAWVKIAGNINSLGARIGHPSRPLTPDNFFIPLLERNGNSASAEFMLPEGAFIEYFYTIGPIGVAQERAEQGRFVHRSFIVGEGGDQRSDRVQYWNNAGWPLVTLKLIPPERTPEDVKIALNMGPSSWMERRDDGTYTTVLGTGPLGTTMSYRYLLGDDFNGADASDAADDGLRTFIAPTQNTAQLSPTLWLVGSASSTLQNAEKTAHSQ